MPDPASRPVVFLPGGVTPVALSYAPLLAELGGEIEPHLKELEVYAADEPPADYSLRTEVAGLARFVDTEGLDTFHLVGFSGGGASSLAYVAVYPERVRSLAIFEPASLPGPLEPDERADFGDLGELMGTLPPDQAMAEFTRWHLRPGVEPPAPPSGPAPAWMARRPAGLAAFMRAFDNDTTDRSAFRRCRFPVYLAYGLLSGESFVRRTQRLAGLLPDVWVQAYEDVHHFVPPQRSHPARYAMALRQLWDRADGVTKTESLHRDPTYAA